MGYNSTFMINQAWDDQKMKDMLPKINMIPSGIIRFTKDPITIENLDHSEI